MDKTILILGVDSSQVGTAEAALKRMSEAGNTAATSAAKVAVATDAQAKKISGSLVPAASKGTLAFADLASAAEKLGPKAAQQLAIALEAAQQKAAKARAEFEALMATPVAPLPLEPRPQVTAVTAAPSARTPLPSPQPVGTVSNLPTGTIAADALRAQAAVTRLTAAARDQRSALTQLSPTVAATAGSYRQLAAAPIRLEAPQGISATAAALASVATQATNANRAITGLNRTSMEAPRPSVASQLLAQQPVSPTAASVAAGARSTPTPNAAAIAQGAAAANALSAAEERAAESAAHLAQANARSEAAQARLNAALLRATQAQAAYDAASRNSGSSADAIAAAQTRLQSAQAGVSVASANAARAQRDAAAAATRHQAALSGTGRQTQLTTIQFQGLTHSVRSFGEMMLAGQNPLRAFIMEAARLSGTFSSPGEVFRGVASLITPMRLAFAGAAVGVGAFALALSKAESAARSLNTVQAQLAATGRKDLFTDASLRVYIAQLSQLPGVSHSAAESIVSEFSKAHAIGGDLFKDLAGLTADYAKATGKEIPDAAKDLAKAFSDPKRGVLDLDSALGTLSSSTILTVERLMRAGDVVGAQRALFDGLKSSVKGLEEQSMTPLQRSVDKLGNSWNGAMRAMEQSQGLRSTNALLAKTVDLVGYLIDHRDAIANVFRVAGASIPIGPLSTAGRIISRAVGGDQQPAGKREVSGKIKPLPGAPRTAAQAAVETTNKAADDDIKRSLEAGEAYRGQEEKIGDLIVTRNRFNNSLKQAIALYGAESEQAKRLRGAIAGVNEQIEAAQKKGGNEAQQVLDAQLEQRVKQARDVLADEQANIQFSQNYLRNAYQAGVISLREYYESQRKAIADGTAAKITALDKERESVAQHLVDTKRTSPKDTSAIVKDQTRLNEIDQEKGKLGVATAREVVLTSQEEAASFKALSESVINYRANLLQMQGDEAGAARLRAQLVIQNARLLAAQANGIGAGSVDVSALARATALTDQFNEVQRRAALLSASSQRAEEAYALAAEQTGLSLRDTEQGVYRIRAAELEQLGSLTEQARELAEASTDPRIKQFAADLAVQYAKAAQSIDPALNRLREAQRELASGISQTVGAAPLNISTFYNERRSQLTQDTKAQKDEYAKQILQLRGYLAEERDMRNKASLQKRIDQLQAESDGLHVESKGKTLLNAISKTVLEPIGQQVFSTVNKLLIQDPLQKYLEGQLKGLTEGSGPLAGFFKDVLGIQADPKQQALLEQTAAISASSQALDVLRAAAESAATALNGNRPLDAEQARLQDGGQNVLAQTNDNQSPAVDSSLDGAPGAAADSLATFGKQASSSASDVLRLANAAGAGSGAMARLPGIVGLFQSAVMAMSGSGAGSSGGFFGALAGLFGKSGGESEAYQQAVSTTGVFHKGGIIGQAKETRSVMPSVFANAPRYHTGGVVGRLADKHLKHNEVAAILMGGPKGKREEVLTADDPRHRDNLGINIVAKIMAESKAGLKVRGAREFGGPVSENSLYRVNEKGPELLQVAGKQYLMTGNQPGSVLPHQPPAGKGGDQHLHVTVSMPQGANRATAQQYGAEVGKQIQRALARN